MLELFDSAIDHGQVFDDRRRWCSVCERAVVPEVPMATEGNPFHGKTCPHCLALWPEHVPEFMAGLASGTLEDGPWTTMETVH